MNAYLLVKWLHVASAVISLGLFVLRLSLTRANCPWRGSMLRWLPHANDSLLLAAAIGLCVITGWMPWTQHWLGAKVVLLLGYIFAGREALKERSSPARQQLFALISLTLVLSIFAVALTKPF